MKKKPRATKKPTATTRLSKSASAEVATLIAAHASVMEAMRAIGRRGWLVSLTATEADGKDYADATLTEEIARTALKAQRDHITAALAGHGIEIR